MRASSGPGAGCILGRMRAAPVLDKPTSATRLLSLEEFLRLPETKPYSELIDGEVVQKPVGKIDHSTAQTNLVILLFVEPTTSGGRRYAELGMRFPRTIRGNLRVPDVSYYRPGRPRITGDYPSELPDLVAEVRSKGQQRSILESRLAFLRGQGVPCTLLIDPVAKNVEVHDGSHTFTASGDETVVLESLGGFSFTVSALFA